MSSNSSESHDDLKNNIRDLCQKFGLKIQDISISKANDERDCISYKKLFEYECKRVTLMNSYLKFMKNTLTVEERKGPKRKESIFNSLIHKPHSQTMETGNTVHKNFYQMIEEYKNTLAKEDGHCDVGKIKMLGLVNLLRFCPSEKSPHYEVAIDRKMKNSKFTFPSGIFSHGDIWSIEEECKYTRFLNCFSMDETKSQISVVPLLRIERGEDLSSQCTITRNGYTLSYDETASSQVGADYMNTIKQFTQTSLQVTDRMERRNFENAGCKQMESQPNVDTILSEFYGLTDCYLRIINDCFIMLREVRQTKRHETSGEEEVQFFFELVFVTIRDKNSKEEESVIADNNADYYFRLFFIAHDLENFEKKTIKSVIVNRRHVNEVVTILKDFKYENYDFCTKLEDGNIHTNDICYDRGIAIKVRAENNSELVRMKEYQTKSELNERLLTLHKIVQGETEGVRCIWELTKEVEEKTKRRKSKVAIKKKEENESELDPSTLFQFNPKCKVSFKGLLLHKEVKYNIASEKTSVIEEIIEPNMAEIIKFLTHKNNTLNSQSYFGKNNLGNLIIPFEFFVERCLETEDDENYYDNVTQTVNVLMNMVFFDDGENVTSIPGWKPNDKEREDLLNVRNYFEVRQDKIVHKDLSALEVFEQYKKYIGKPKEKEIIQHVIFNLQKGPIYFSELKCKILSPLHKIRQVENVIFNTKDFSISPRGDKSQITEDQNFEISTNFEEDSIKRVTTRICEYESFKLVYQLEEPNLRSILIFLHGNKLYLNPQLAKSVRNSKEILKLFECDIKRQAEKISENNSHSINNCTCKGLPLKYSQFLIRSRTRIFLEMGGESCLLEEYQVPKLVNLKCYLCQPVITQIIDGNFEPITFGFPDEIIDCKDLQLALEQLDYESSTAKDDQREELSMKKYKQRIQRCIKSI